MKNKLTLFVSISMLLLTSLQLNAQVNEVWKKNIEGSVIWQKVNSFGNYIVCTSNELAAVNPETGEKIWSNSDFAGIAETQIEELTGSPLMSINQNEVISMIDPFSGDIKFNSSKAGVNDLQTKKVLFKSNGLLIAGKDIENNPVMLMIDLATGNTVWKIEEKFGKIINVNELTKEDLLIVSLFNIYKINPVSGDVIWKSTTSKEAEQIENMGAFGSLLGSLAEEMVGDEEFVLHFWKHPSKNIFLLGNDEKSERQSGSNTVVTYENYYNAFDIETGKRLWKDPVSMNGQIGRIEFYKDGIIVLPNDGGSTKINFFSLENPVGTWGKKAKGTKIKGGIYNSLKVENGYLLISGANDKNYLNFLDPEQGIMTFEKPVKIDGQVIRTIDTPNGILYITTEEINILNPTAGTLYFEKSIACDPNMMQQKGDFLYVFDKKEKVLKTVNTQTAEVKNITTEELKFEGKEKPTNFELRDNGIFLSSEQNVALFDYNGSKIFQEYYEAPREPGLKRALLIAQAARAAYIAVNANHAVGQLQSAAREIKEEDAISGAIVEGFGQFYEEMGKQASDFATQSIQQAFARFKATAEGRDFMMVFGKIEKDNALLKVNKNTGKVDGSINLGKEKEPVYAVDDVTGQVFYKTSETEITSYKF